MTSVVYDGSSWANAYKDLQNALTIANAGDQIWVADGTYYPTEPSATADRNVIFELVSRVEVYGGFSGDVSETSISQRNWITNETILDGDIGDPDNPNTYKDTSSFGNRTENSYHVVLGAADARLDGFTIRGGYNVDEPDGFGKLDPLDEFYGGGKGAGLYIDTDMTIANCNIQDNWSGSYGGGVYIENAAVNITNCLIVDNRAYVINVEAQGAGIYGYYTTGYENKAIDITNCTVSGNVSTNNSLVDNNGGGIHIRDNTNTQINNSIVWDNALLYNAVHYQDDILANNSFVTVIYSNYGYSIGVINGGGNIAVDPFFENANPVVANPDVEDYHLKSTVGRWDGDPDWVLDGAHSLCIDAGDPADSGYAIEPSPNGGIINMGYYGGTAYASKRALKGSVTVTITPSGAASGTQWVLYYQEGSTLFPFDRVLYNSGATITNVPTGNYDIFVTDIRGYLPTASSWFAPISLNGSSYRGFFRVASYTVVEGSNNFEIQYDEVDEIYVSKTGNGNHTGNPGSSYRTIQAAIDNIGPADTVWVYSGTYDENITINDNIVVRSNSGQLNTIISGVNPGSVVTINSGVLGAYQGGFTITGGSGNSSDKGGGVYMTDGIVQYCNIKDNSATIGGGVYMTGVIPPYGTVQYCDIWDNTAKSWGGGVYMNGGTLESCNIAFNDGVPKGSGVTIGGGIYATFGTVKNCDVYNNKAATKGGGIHYQGEAVEVVTEWRTLGLPIMPLGFGSFRAFPHK